MYEKLLFPLAAVRVSMEKVEEGRVDPGVIGESFDEKKYKCPNCTKAFALGDLYSLNLSTKKKNKNIKKKEEKKTEKKNLVPSKEILLGKRKELEMENNVNEQSHKLEDGLKKIKVGSHSNKLTIKNQEMDSKRKNF
jgi:hypothetical protein